MLNVFSFSDLGVNKCCVSSITLVDLGVNKCRVFSVNLIVDINDQIESFPNTPTDVYYLKVLAFIPLDTVIQNRTCCK